MRQPHPETLTLPGSLAGAEREPEAVRQFKAFKQAHPDSVLFFKQPDGAGYNVIQEDADTLHRFTGWQIQPDTSPPHPLRLCHVPSVDLERVLRRMIHAGHRCAVCERIT